MRASYNQRTGTYVFLVGASGIVGLIFAFAISAGARHGRELPNMPHWSEQQIATALPAQSR